MRRHCLATLGWLAGIVLAAGLCGCSNTSKPPETAYSGAGDQADAEFAQAANRPPAPKTLYAMAQILAIKGNDAGAEVLLRRVIRESPGFLPAYCDLAELQMRQRRTDEAVAVLSAGLGVAPQDGVLLNNLGMCWLAKEDYRKALDCFSRAAGAAPGDCRYRSNMAMALGMMGRYDEALALYEQVLPPHEAHRNVAILCMARRDMARADKEYGLAEALEPASTASGS